MFLYNVNPAEYKRTVSWVHSLLTLLLALAFERPSTSHSLSEVAGGTPEENAETFRLLLTSGENIPERLTPQLDFVLLNAAALLVVAGVANLLTFLVRRGSVMGI